MTRDLTSYLTRPWPHYASYPLVECFTPQVAAADYQARLEQVGLYEPLSLYIHMPFFGKSAIPLSLAPGTLTGDTALSAYVSGVHKEIAKAAAALSGRGRVVRVCFGGTMPNRRATSVVARLLDSIERHFGLTDTADISLNADARVLSYQDINDISQLGINKITLDVPDFDVTVQQAIGRVQPARMVAEIVAAFRAVGIFDVGFDMTYAMPQQTLPSVLESLALAAQMSPDRIMFANAVNTDASSGQLMTQSALKACLDRACAARKALTGHGYQRTGFDHFALPGSALALAAQSGRLYRSLDGYSAAQPCSTIGLGPSAISQFPNLMVKNPSRLNAYLEAVEDVGLPTCCGRRISSEEQVRGAIISDLMSGFRANVAKRCAERAVSTAILNDAFVGLKPLVKAGLVTFEDGVIRVQSAAEGLVPMIANVFDRHKSIQTSLSSTH